MEHKKILFFDVDGTLTNSKGRVPESTVRALGKIKEGGHILFVNSGRTLFDVEANPEISGLGFDGYISGCGSHIRYRGKDLRFHEFPKELHEKLIRRAEELEIGLFLEGPYCVYVDWANRKKLNKDELLNRLAENVRDYYTKDHNIGDLCFQKFLCWGKKENLLQLAEDFGDIFEAIWKADGAGEFVMRGLDKGESMEEVLSFLGFDKDDCIVVGDSENDETMFTHCKHSILIGNQAKKLLPMAEYVSASSDEDGVYQALEHYGLL